MTEKNEIENVLVSKVYDNLDSRDCFDYKKSFLVFSLVTSEIQIKIVNLFPRHLSLHVHQINEPTFKPNVYFQST